jgi:hypothetical protein
MRMIFSIQQQPATAYHPGILWHRNPSFMPETSMDEIVYSVASSKGRCQTGFYLYRNDRTKGYKYAA